MNQLIDTHAHLDVKQFKPDFENVIERAKIAGVTTIINIGPSVNSAKAATQLENDQIKMFSTIGLHPEYVPIANPAKSIPEKIRALEKIYLANPQKVIGVGECGLDFFSTSEESKPTSEVFIQKKLFQAQIDLARKLNLPLIIHCRSAWEDIFNFDFTGISGVFHSFTSNFDDAQKALNLGFYLSFSCIITYPKNEYLREIIKFMPQDKILTETDCPFLPPQSKRGQRCEPADVVEVVKVIAQIKDLSCEKIAQVTFHNAQILFHFS
ncbi:MAG: TatD family hydrolase [Candidatus Daviesbacteria bacterium]|nr:TatD family hydrolase [Candidatus Daviesbacteria bacterium]